MKWQWFLLPLLLTTTVAANSDDCPGHWHGVLDIYVEGDLVQLDPTGPAGDFHRSPAQGMHIHTDDGILHFHPAVKACIPLQDAFEKLGINLQSDRLILDESQTNPHGEWVSNDTHELVVNVRSFGQEWQAADLGTLLPNQLENGASVFISYHPVGEGAPLQQARSLPDHYIPPPSASDSGSPSGDGKGEEASLPFVLPVLAVLMAMTRKKSQ